MAVTYSDIQNARKESADLRAMLRQDIEAARAKVRDLKAQVNASKAEDRAAWGRAFLVLSRSHSGYGRS